MQSPLKALESLVSGNWAAGVAVAGNNAATLVNPTTEVPVATATTDGLDLPSALEFARTRGQAELAALTFKQRGGLLRGLSRAIHAARDELLEAAILNGGNTRSDAKFDIDGASGTLAAYADLGETLGDATFLVDGEPTNIGRTSKLVGQHVYTTLQGAALHINAFNFPAWGLAEKAACALLAGMPLITKPATSTALVAHAIAQLVVNQKLLPVGTFSFLCGSTGDLVGRLRGQDVLAFTGSSDTGAMLRAATVPHAVRVNVEADSLNAAVLGPDIVEGSEVWGLFLKDVTRDLSQKAGQKCTAIRRVFVPRAQLSAIRDELSERVGNLSVGDPALDVDVGPVATKKQQQDVLAGIIRLAEAGAKVLVGGGLPRGLIGGEVGKGFFVAPTLLEVEGVFATPAVHDFEVFGPVTTLIPYDSSDELFAGLRRGGGSLVASVYADDKAFLRALILAVASSHGRLVLGCEKNAASSVPPGTVLPSLIHGGPGRAGGGEELGGIRGLRVYQQRTAVQGYGPLVASLVAGGHLTTL